MADLSGPNGGPLQVPRTNLDVVRAALALRPQPDFLVMLAVATVAAGLFFKVAAVPFHQWAPDVYEGAPTTITAYISVASKTARASALLLRLFLYAFWPVRVPWIEITGDRRRGHSLAHAWQLCRHHADEHQADAGLLLDFACGLPPARPGGSDDGRGRKRDRVAGYRLLPVRIRLL